MKKKRKFASVISAFVLTTAGLLLHGAETPANFDEKLWRNGSFEASVPVKKTTWMLENAQGPAYWWLDESGKGEKRLSILKHPDGKGSFIRIKGGTLLHDLSPKGSKFTISYRYRGKGSCYFYVIPYNKKGGNLPSKLALYLNKIDEKEWKDGKLEFDQPLEDGGRRIFMLVIFPKSEFDFDSIFISIK